MVTSVTVATVWMVMLASRRQHLVWVLDLVLERWRSAPMVVFLAGVGTTVFKVYNYKNIRLT